MSNKNTQPLALYVHWPYCLSKCPYCDFNSHVTNTVDHGKWRHAYEADLKAHKAHIEERRITSIFFGGGTPSLMEPETVAHVIETARMLWDFDDNIEITLEANPTSIESAKFKAFADAEINRVSVGIQALNDPDLKALGREHNAKEALNALDIAGAHFDRFSFDLIYTREGQTLDAWKRELSQAIPFAQAGHMSLYQLTIEPGTQFKTLFDSGRLILPDDDISASFYETTMEMMDHAGLPLYEISNYAAKGQESKHNLSYWYYRDYVGIGPGAHSRLRVAQSRTDTTRLEVEHHNNGNDNQMQTIATRAHKAPDIWLDHVLRPTHEQAPFQNARTISQQDQFDEMILMGLRLRDGVNFSDVKKRTKVNLLSRISNQRLTALSDEGLLHYDDQSLRLTSKGFSVLDSITSHLLSS